jgi:hypothetical protein
MWQSQQVAMNKDGSCVVGWSGSDGASGIRDVYLQRYSATGATIGANVIVNTDTDGNQDGALIGMDGSGNFTIFWSSSIGNTLLGLFGQRFDANGARIGGQFLLEPDPNGSFVNFAMAPNGDFVLVRQPNNSSSVLLERFNAAGVRQGAPVTVTDATNLNVKANVTLDQQGNAVVVYGLYRSNWGVYTRRFNSAGVPLGTETRVDAATYTGTDYGAVSGASVSAGLNGYVVNWAGPTARFYRTATAGDADGDGNVNFNDLARLAQNYNVSTGKAWVDGDFNGDGAVDFTDLAMMAQKYNTSAGGSAVAGPTFQEALAAAFASPVTNANPKTVSTPPVLRPKPKPVVPQKPVVMAKPKALPPKRMITLHETRPVGIFSTRWVPVRTSKDLLA